MKKIILKSVEGKTKNKEGKKKLIVKKKKER